MLLSHRSFEQDYDWQQLLQVSQSDGLGLCWLMVVVKGLAHVSQTASLKMIRKMSTILSPLTLVASPVVTSFLAGCSRFPPSFAAGEDEVAGSSARIVSSFDSTPARKEPHLDEALNGPEDAISDYVADCNDAR